MKTFVAAFLLCSLSAFAETVSTNDAPPAVPIHYAGFDWIPMRTDFEVRDDTLSSLPRVRKGFDYGHGGHGRGATILTHVGDAAWRDYSVEMDVCCKGIDPALNPHGLDSNWLGFAIIFRSLDAKESWNEKGSSCCVFGTSGSGTSFEWHVSAYRNSYCNTPRGWCPGYNGGDLSITSGTGIELDRERGNHVRIDVQGARIQIWFDGKQLCDTTDMRLLQPFEDVVLDHGGIGIQWGFDTMGWVKNIKVRGIGETANNRPSMTNRSSANSAMPEVEAGGGLAWKNAGNFPVACGMPAATLADGRIFVMGGYNGSWLSQVRSLDPAKPETGWRSEKDILAGRAALAAVTANGKIYSIGGQPDNIHGPQADVYSYDPRQPDHGWKRMSDLPAPLLRHAAVSLDARIYVIGGVGTNGVQSAVYEFDTVYPAEGWRLLNHLPGPRNSLAATVLDGKIYAIGGGDDHEAQSTVFVFDPAHREQGWRSVSNLPAPRYVLAAASANGKLYAIGGFDVNQTGVSSVYVYDPSQPSRGWLNAGNLPAVRGEAPVVVVNGKIIVISGADRPCHYQPSIYEASFQ